MLDLRYVKKLVEMLDDSSVDEIEISTEKGLKIRVGRSSHTQVVHTAAPAPMPVVMAAPELRLSPAAGVPVAAEPEAPAKPVVVSNLIDLKSPMVGTYYAAAEPGGKPFVTVGAKVAKGQVLCIIEAMKIMNEIEAEHAGTVRELLATEAHPVEFGQVMMRVEPNG